MRPRLFTAAAVASATVAAVVGAAASTPAAASGAVTHRNVHACTTTPGKGQATCFAQVHQTLHDGQVQPNVTPSGYGPADLQDAYKLASAAATQGGNQTVALVDAFDDPNAGPDLQKYRAQYGLPVCNKANGCFRKVNQNGGTTPPAADAGWAVEISLDLDMVSAICPNCHILLVEATTSNFSDLGAAVNRAATMGATEISNSYGSSGEFSGETNLDSNYNHPGVAITASSGDSGFGVIYPAASPFVTAVGGTTLRHAQNSRGWSESAWSGAGSGCSAFEARPAWQTNASNIKAHCPRRAVADVSAEADPNTGVAVYDSYQEPGWLVVGGTSASSPMIASVYALAGNAASVNYGQFPYTHKNYSSTLFDVTTGSNGSCGNLLCQGHGGWDGPTGLGTPDGTGAF